MNARTAAIAGCALLAVATVISYAIGDGTNRLMGTVPLGRRLADTVPMTLGGWKGTDDPMSKETIAMTKVDDYVRRRYSDPSGAQVLLYVAYHGNKERGMQTYFHNPTVCFPSQGWNLDRTVLSTETLNEAAKEVPLCRYVFSKEGTRLSVMTFFRVQSESEPPEFLDQSPRNKPLWTFLDRATPQFSDSPGTFVQVQIITTVGSRGEAAAADLQSRFLADFGSAILRAVEPGHAQ